MSILDTSGSLVLGNTNSIQDDKGFTITELIVAMTAGTIVAIVILSITLFFFADIMRIDAETRLLSEAQTALNRVVEDMRTGSEILVSNTLTDSNEPMGGWTTSNTDLVLIVSTPSIDTTNNFIFDSDSGNPFQDEFIYFTDGDNLYKRILSNPTAPDNTSLTTCPSAIATAACPADKLMTNNFDDMTFNFFDQDNSPTADPTLARSAQINILMRVDSFGQTIKAENNIRMSLRNPQS